MPPMSADGQLPGHLIRVAGTDRLFHRGRVLGVLLAILAMTMLAVSSLNVALPSIASSLAASPTDLQWLLSGYALAFGIVLVSAGRVGDVLGRSSVFAVGVAVFTVSCLGCALATEPSWLNLSRAVQGVGAGIASPQVNGMILQYFSGRARARAFALFGLVISVSVAAAPLLTGLLIQALGPELGWRMTFWWTVPIGVATFAVLWRWLPFETERRRRIDRAGRHAQAIRLDLDPVGMVLLTGAVLCIMGPFLLREPIWFSLLAAGAGLLTGWVAWERRYAAHGRSPMVDLGLFRHRSFTNGTLVSGTLFVGGTSVFVIIALYLQSGLGASALVVGLIGLPNAIGSAWASIWAGERVLHHGRRIVVAACMLYLLGLVAAVGVALLGPSLGPAGYCWLALPLTAVGAGMGAIGSCNQTLSQADIPPAVGGTAGAVKQVAERIGTAVGITIISAVFFWMVPRGWTSAFVASYAVIALFISLTAVFALLDLRALGDGAGRGVPGPASSRTID